MLPYSNFTQAKAVPQGKPLRVYGVLGDSYLQKRVTRQLIEWRLPEDARDFNLDTLEGESIRLQDLLGVGQNLPFLSEHRVVVVRHAERLEGLDRGEDDTAKKSKDATQRFIDGIGALPATTVIILARTPETPEPGSRARAPVCINSAADKAIEKLGLIVNCTIAIKETTLAVKLLMQEAELRGIRVEQSAAAHLVARQGHGFDNLLQELEKCSLRAGTEAPVTKAIIDEMTSRTSQESIFALTDALGQRQTSRAIQLLREELDSGTAPEQILQLLTRHLRQLLQARTLLDAGVRLEAGGKSNLPAALAAQWPEGRGDIFANLQSSFVAGKLTQQARNFSALQIERALQQAFNTDLALKGIEGDGGSPELLLELMVTRLG